MAGPDGTPPLDGDKTPTPTPPPDGETPTPTPPAPDAGDDGIVENEDGTITIPKAKADEWKAQRKEANRQAKVKSRGEKEALARAEAAEARLKEIDDANKTEVQKAQEERDAAKAALVAAEREAKTARLSVDVSAAGAKPGRCARAVLEDLDEALEADPKLDKIEWFKEYRESNPEFFGGNGKPPPPAPDTAGGGPTTPPNSEVARLNQDLKDYQELIKGERDRQKRIEHQRAIRIIQGRITQITGG